MEMQDLLQHFRLMAQQIGARSVYGEPVVHGDKTIVPVASVAFGFGGGFGQNQDRHGEGGGGGGRFGGIPAVYIDVTPSGTRFVPIYEKTKISVAVLAGVALGMFVGKFRR